VDIGEWQEALPTLSVVLVGQDVDEIHQSDCYSQLSTIRHAYNPVSDSWQQTNSMKMNPTKLFKNIVGVLRSCQIDESQQVFLYVNVTRDMIVLYRCQKQPDNTIKLEM
jgi:hypothetical protein